MAQHKTLAFFIPHRGCPHQCSFCDQRTISGTVQAPTPEEVTQTCQAMLERSGSLESAEIAFFGGSFTAVEPAYQILAASCSAAFLLCPTPLPMTLEFRQTITSNALS